MESGPSMPAETYERLRGIVGNVLEADPPICTLGEAAKLFEAAAGPDFFEASLRTLVPLLEPPTYAASTHSSLPDYLIAANVSAFSE